MTAGDEPVRATPRWRTAAYWAATLLVAFELVASSIWAVVGTEYVAATLTRLGYPMYLQTILGIWDLPGALVLLLPRFPRLKEWAYAGAFFKYSGAVASHALVGTDPAGYAPALVFAMLTGASWATRPDDRRVAAVGAGTVRLLDWGLPFVAIGILASIALLTLPA